MRKWLRPGVYRGAALFLRGERMMKAIGASKMTNDPNGPKNHTAPKASGQSTAPTARANPRSEDFVLRRRLFLVDRNTARPKTTATPPRRLHCTGEIDWLPGCQDKIQEHYRGGSCRKK